MLFDGGARKPFEVPKKNDFYVAVLVDVVDVGEKLTKYGPQFQTRFVWLLNEKDSEGKHLQVIRTMNAKLTPDPKPSTLYLTVKDVLNAPPMIPFDGESLIGRCNRLFIEVVEVDKKKYANIKLILPLDAGQSPIPIPADYIRVQNREKKMPGPMAAPAAQLPQQQSKPPVNLNAPAPVAVGAADSSTF